MDKTIIDLIVQIGVPSAFSLGVLYLFNEYLKTDRTRTKEQASVNLKESETQASLAKAIQTQASVFASLEQAIKSSTEVNQQVASTLNNQGIAINTLEQHVIQHTTDSINPFKAIHQGHTDKLLSIQESNRQLLEAVKSIESTAQIHHTENMTALNRLSTSIRERIQQTASEVTSNNKKPEKEIS